MTTPDVTDLTKYPVGTNSLYPLGDETVGNATVFDKVINGGIGQVVTNRAGAELKTIATLINEINSTGAYTKAQTRQSISGDDVYLGSYDVAIADGVTAVSTGATVKHENAIWEPRAPIADISTEQPSDTLWINCGVDGFTFKSLSDAVQSLRVYKEELNVSVAGYGDYVVKKAASDAARPSGAFYANLNSGATGGWYLEQLLVNLPTNTLYVDAPPFNGDLGTALDYVKDQGSPRTLILGMNDYNIVGKYQLDTVAPSGGGTWLGIEIAGVVIKGSGMPQLSTDETRFVSGSGTVIQGALINFADGFECYDLGIDVGDYVVDTLASGTYMEGFVAGTHKLDTAWNDTESTYINDVHFNNIKVLLKQAGVGAETKKHGLLIERIDGGSIGYCETIGGEHGFAYKSRNMLGGDIRAWRQTGDAAIFKTDAFTECCNWAGGQLYVGKEGHAVRTANVLFQAANGTRLKGISFDYKARNAKGLERVYDGATTRLEDVIIRSADIDDTTITAITIPSIADRWHIGEHTIVNVPYGIGTENGCIQCTIGNGSVINAVTDGYRLNGDVKHGLISSRNAGAWGVNNQGIIVDPSRISGEGNGSGNLSGLFNANAFVAPLNSWADASFGSVYGADILDGKLVMRGRLGSGTSAVLANVSASFRPKTDKRFVVVGHNGTNITSAYITVYSDSGEAITAGFTDGDIVLTDYTSFNGGGAAGVSLDGLEWTYIT